MEGDIFKLGREVFKVLEIRINIDSVIKREVEKLAGNEQLRIVKQNNYYFEGENAANEFTTLQYNNYSRIPSKYQIGSSQNSRNVMRK